MIYFFYHGNYLGIPFTECAKDEYAMRDKECGLYHDLLTISLETEGYANFTHPQILHHARVYAIAEQYNIAKLRDLSHSRLELAVEEDWDPLAFIAALRFMYDNLSENDRYIKPKAIKVARTRLGELCSVSEFRMLCEEKGDLACKILTRVTRIDELEAEDWEAYKVDMFCQECGSEEEVTVVEGDEGWDYECADCGEAWSYPYDDWDD